MRWTAAWHPASGSPRLQLAAGAQQQPAPYAVPCAPVGTAAVAESWRQRQAGVAEAAQQQRVRGGIPTPPGQSWSAPARPARAPSQATLRVPRPCHRQPCPGRRRHRRAVHHHVALVLHGCRPAAEMLQPTQRWWLPPSPLPLPPSPTQRLRRHTPAALPVALQHTRTPVGEAAAAGRRWKTWCQWRHVHRPGGEQTLPAAGHAVPTCLARVLPPQRPLPPPPPRQRHVPPQPGAPPRHVRRPQPALLPQSRLQGP